MSVVAAGGIGMLAGRAAAGASSGWGAIGVGLVLLALIVPLRWGYERSVPLVSERTQEILRFNMIGGTVILTVFGVLLLAGGVVGLAR